MELKYFFKYSCENTKLFKYCTSLLVTTGTGAVIKSYPWQQQCIEHVIRYCCNSIAYVEMMMYMLCYSSDPADDKEIRQLRGSTTRLVIGRI